MWKNTQQKARDQGLLDNKIILKIAADNLAKQTSLKYFIVNLFK